jgi:hypothetical protein
VIIVTLLTCADASDARLDLACELMTDANCDPSWSRLTRLETAVFGLKKAVQFVVMSFWSAEMADVPDVLEVAEAVADGDAAGGELLLLPQAAKATLAAHTSRIIEMNFRVITQSLSSFRLALAMVTLTSTSARPFPDHATAVVAAGQRTTELTLNVTPAGARGLAPQPRSEAA